MSTRLVLAGAGAFGRVVHSWVITSPQFLEANNIEEVAFIDDGNPSVKPNAPILTGISNFEPRESDLVICTVGNPAARRIVVNILQQKHAHFGTFIDSRAAVGENVAVGPGVVICPGTVVQPNVTIGAHVHIGSNCTIGHDTVIGEFTSLSPQVNLMSTIEVGEEVFFGGSSVILPEISIKSEVAVGAGSVVTKSVPAKVTVIGVPGRW